MFRIAVDLDDTLCNTSDIIREKAKEFHINQLRREVKYKKLEACEDYFYFAHELGWNDKDVTEFFKASYPYYLYEVKPISDMVDAINSLYDIGHEIYVVTSRKPNDVIDVENLTRDWANSNNLTYTNIIIDSKNKVEVIRNLKCDIFIDDSYKNCQDVKNELNNIKVCLYSTGYNKNYSLENITRINKGNELLDIIKKMEE